MARTYPDEDSLSESSMEDGLKGSRDAQQHIPLLPFRPWSPSALKETFSPTAAASFAWRARAPSRFPYVLAARRRTVLLMVVLMAAAGSIPLMLYSRLGARELEQLPAERLDMNPPLPASSPSAAVEEVEEVYPEDDLPEHLRPEMWLEGEAATEHVRDSLRNDTAYVTSFLSAGWTNDQITIGNLIYLGMITGRVPILPPFTSYIDAAAQPLPFSEIFDVPRLARAIDSPVLEWHMVKDVDLAHSHASRDHIGCWNIWEVDDLHSDGPRGSYSTALLALGEHLSLSIDHDAERTGETYGNWYPVVLDAVVQSMAIGFVGTDRSTFSHMARRRVDDWNDGASRLVKWGYPGADDH
ncbi:hypothetical protein FKP32DRAFT_1599461 [Trametes sanguinea]|nr:hypothetical protein FKP32DRAFT_1599461 [Trametes sanguinea]